MSKKENNIDRKLLSPWQRIGTLLLDFTLVFFLALFFDRVIVNPIAKNVTPLTTLQTEYDKGVDEYQKLEDKYGLYYYTSDSSKTRTKNSEVTNEQLDAFLKDERVIELRKELPSIQDQLQVIRLSKIGIDTFLASLIYFLFAYVLFGLGRSFGLFMFKARMRNLDGTKLSFKQALLYGFLKWLMLFPLAILTILILPLKMLYDLFYHDNVTFLEKKLKIECRINVKDID